MSPFEEGEEDPWPDEPDEFDPESLGPGTPETPSVRDYSESAGDAPEDVKNAFWAAVVFANVGLMGVSLGAMFVFFESAWRLGGGLFLVGVVALLMTYRQYRDFMNRDRDDQEDPTTGGD